MVLLEQKDFSARQNFNSSYLHLRHGLWFDRSNISRWVCNSHRLFNFSGDFGFLDGLCLDSLETNTRVIKKLT